MKWEIDYKGTTLDEDNTKYFFEKQPDLKKFNLTLAILSRIKKWTWKSFPKFSPKKLNF